MWATPLSVSTLPSYYDDPESVIELVKSLSHEEAQIFTLGYLQACEQVKESYGETKTRLLNVVLNEDASFERRGRATSLLKMLDMLDNLVTERINDIVESMFPE